jgi:F420-0:gamma-glutamyl ligase
MADMLGTVSMGIRAPIIRAGDDLVKIVTDCIVKAAAAHHITLNDRDIVSVTEAVLARSQGNYATVDQIAKDVADKFGNETVGLVFPILSRNRFSLVLKGIARGVKKLVVQLSYPADEVGNHLISLDALDELGIDPHTRGMTEAEFRKICPEIVHRFTGVDYIELYRALGDNIEVVLSNDPAYILKYAKNVICADIHSRARTKRILEKAGAKKVYGLSDILSRSVDGSGYHPEYGLLGSNLATADSVKLFPRDAGAFVTALQQSLRAATGKQLECMVYGDGAFKDPVGGIWELADPVVSPGFTDGLLGTPNEMKLKYLADNDIPELSGEDAELALKRRIAEKQPQTLEALTALGTTPRRLTDLIGTLSDLTSGSGDKGTPIILIQNYFKDFSK